MHVWIRHPESGEAVKQLDFEIIRLKAERDEAVRNANEYRQRVLDFLNGMIAESLLIQETEEGRGLKPIDREQFRHAVDYIRRAFTSHNYLIEAKTEGTFAVLKAQP